MPHIQWQWKWILFQVLLPILGPIVISAAMTLLWSSGQPSFVIQWAVVTDVTPWALIFFSVTLIGSTLNDFWSKLSDHKMLGLGLLFLMIAVCAYAGFLVIWRHDPQFVPGAPVYYVTIVLLVLTVVLCHQIYAKSK